MLKNMRKIKYEPGEHIYGLTEDELWEEQNLPHPFQLQIKAHHLKEMYWSGCSLAYRFCYATVPCTPRNYFGIQVCPHENLTVIPSLDKRKGENARTFRKYPRGTRSGAGGKFIWKDIKAGHCSRLYLLLSFIRIHYTFNFQMFERVLLFPARNTVP